MKTDYTGAPDQAEIAELVAYFRVKAVSFAPERAKQTADALELLAADARRIDWLAAPDNSLGNVHLPAAAVEPNLHSLRAAIDAAMALNEKERTA